MHPVLFNIGSFHLPTYGVLLALGLVGSLATVVRLGRREGLDPARLIDFCTWLIVVGLVGAKVLMLLTDWKFYSAHPSEVFSWATLQAGGVFYGGFAAAALFALWYTRVYRLPALRVFDVCAPAVALGQSIGRLGCFAAGCDYGKPTALAWGVVFTKPYSHDLTGVPLGVRLHPAQIYESLATLAIFGILLWGYRAKKRAGQIFWLYLTLYALARFFLEYLRGDEDRGFVFNHLLSTSQFIAVVALVVAGIFYWRVLCSGDPAPAGSPRRGAAVGPRGSPGRDTAATARLI